MIYSIIYQSKANDQFSKPEIDRMLLKAKRKNKKNSITGCIIFHDNQFIQIIEGPKKSVQELYSIIKKDKRHKNVITLLETTTQESLWNEWSMAFYHFGGDRNHNKHSRILLEAYFNAANLNVKTSDTFNVLKSNVLELLKDV